MSFITTNALRTLTDLTRAADLLARSFQLELQFAPPPATKQGAESNPKPID